MAQFTVNAQRFDPYKNFKFRVKWDGRYVAGVSKVERAQAHDRGRQAPRGRRPEHAAASRPAAPSTRRSRSSAASPTTSSSSSGRTRSGTSAPGLGAEVSLKDFRKDIIIEVYNEAGQLALAYKVFRCWVSEYQALPDLDANANAVAIQHIKLENEGWERDVDVTEPTEPSFTEPAWPSGRDATDRNAMLLPLWEAGEGAGRPRPRGAAARGRGAGDAVAASRCTVGAARTRCCSSCARAAFGERLDGFVRVSGVRRGAGGLARPGGACARSSRPSRGSASTRSCTTAYALRFRLATCADLDAAARRGRRRRGASPARRAVRARGAARRTSRLPPQTCRRRSSWRSPSDWRRSIRRPTSRSPSRVRSAGTSGARRSTRRASSGAA